MSKFYSALLVSLTCFRPHRSIIRSVLYKLYSQTLVCGNTRTTWHVQPLQKCRKKAQTWAQQLVPLPWQWCCSQRHPVLRNLGKKFIVGLEQPPPFPLFTKFWLPVTTGSFQNEHLLCWTWISRYWKCPEKCKPIQCCFSGYQMIKFQRSNQIFVWI